MKPRLFRPALLVLALSFCVDTPSARSDEAGTRAYMKGVRSAVYIKAPEWAGSGFVIDLKKGLVLTNWHVVDGLKEVQIVFPLWERGRPIAEKSRYDSRLNQLALRAKVITSEQRVDLGVVQILEPSRIPEGTEQVAFADDSPLPGTNIVSIGNPGASDARWVYTPGEVRTVYIKKWEAGAGNKVNSHEARIIEATSPTTHGDSGGPCFNGKCELVGVTQGGMRATVAQGYSYFVDVTEVKKFLRAHKVNLTEGAVALNDPPESRVSGEPKPAGGPGPAAEPKTAPTAKTNPVPARDPAVRKDPPKAESAGQEKSAENELKLIRGVAKDLTRREAAADLLRKLIRKYPGTEAAKEAQKLLKEIQ